jgi:hypothetical protein
MLDEPALNTQFYSVPHDLKRAPGTPVRGQGSDHPEIRDDAVEEGAAPLRVTRGMRKSTTQEKG